MHGPGNPEGRDFPPREAVKEYGFDAGVEEAVARITKIFGSGKRDVFVVINGSHIEVGKTRLFGTLAVKLKELGYQVESLGDDSFNAYEYFKQQPHNKNTSKIYISQVLAGVLPSGAEQYRSVLAKAGHRIVADLYVGIYRPDRPFSGKGLPIADMVIRNEEAKNR